METGLVLLWFLVGLVLIVKGGDWFVEAAVYFAQKTGIPNVLIGATLVSVTTTLPELTVSVLASYQELYDVAIGNVVGSLICNVGLILGLTALLSPIPVRRQNFMIKGGFMLLSAALVFFFLKDKIVTPREGNVLLIFFLVYILLNIVEFKQRDRAGGLEPAVEISLARSGLSVLLQFGFGALFIIVGARLLVKHGVTLAVLIGIPEQIVSLTMIALGTSLPELITAVAAVMKRQQGISIGNILGANTLNLLMVVGLSSKISNPGLIISHQHVMLGAQIYLIPQTLYLDLPVALLLMLALVLGGLLWGRIGRRLGLLLLSCYGMYLFVLAKLFL